MTLRSIHHFEDEPELVRWIPGVLLKRYWLDNPDWTVDGGNYEEAEDEVLIRFRLRSVQPATIEYRVYRTEEEFRSQFDRRAKPGDVVLLDIMSESPVDGSQVPFGLAAYDLAVQAVGEKNVCFLTAFPQQLVRKGVRVVEKPPDADALITLIVSILRIE
jgi:hypothetical protein